MNKISFQFLATLGLKAFHWLQLNYPNHVSAAWLPSAAALRWMSAPSVSKISSAAPATSAVERLRMKLLQEERQRPIDAGQAVDVESSQTGTKEESKDSARVYRVCKESKLMKDCLLDCHRQCMVMLAVRLPA
jgi:hypothetical protein